MKKKPYKVIGGRRCWQCSRCKKWKWKGSYYKDKRTSNGLKCQCKECHIECSMETRDKINTRKLNREHMRRARKVNPEKFKERERLASQKRIKGPAYRAYRILHRAILRGDIHKPLRCQECSRRRKLTAHHEDYSKPLEVEWLCYECHGRRSWKD